MIWLFPSNNLSNDDLYDTSSFGVMMLGNLMEI